MVIGLTGGIGSGKSTVLNFFKELGCQVFIADIEAKKLMESDKTLVEKISNLFGKQAYTNNKLNRKLIASIVFSDEKKLKALNNLVHPVVHKAFENFKDNHKDEIIIYEAAILFESGNDKNCDFIITVFALKEERIKRLVKRDLATSAEIELRMNNQTNDEYRIKRSHFVIKNSKLASTKIQVFTIFSLLKLLDENIRCLNNVLKN
jgi:dephospho-CoA kinase